MITWALSFDGIDDYVSFGKLGYYSGDLTFEVLISISEMPQVNGTVISDYRTGGHNLALSTNGEVIFAGRGTKNIYRSLMSNNVLKLDSFYHIVGIIKNGTWHLYLNGDLESVGEWGDNGLLGYTTTGLGRLFPTLPSNFFNGKIVFARLWERALLETEISQFLFKEDIPTEDPALRGYWKLDEGQGDIVNDYGPRGNHGTIYGATWVEVDIPGDEDPPGMVTLSARLAGGASMVCSTVRGRGLSASLSGGAELYCGTPIRTRGFSAQLAGGATLSTRANLIASLKANLAGGADLRAGILRLIIPKGIYEITKDNYFTKNQPAKSGELANLIKVYTNPLRPTETPEEVYRSDEPIILAAGQSKSVTAFYNKKPVIEAVAALEEAGVDLSITKVIYYAWGANVKITNSGSSEQSCIIVVNGRPLEVQGQRLITAQDDQSIRENGLIEFEFPSNPLVQTPQMAERIANNLLAFAVPRRDVSLEWRGNPALTLADLIQVPEYQRGLVDVRGIFYVTRQQFEYDGTLRARTEGRKINQ